MVSSHYIPFILLDNIVVTIHVFPFGVWECAVLINLHQFTDGKVRNKSSSIQITLL